MKEWYSEWYSENGLTMNSNKTQCILFATQNFNKRTETFQTTIDGTVKKMEDKVKNRWVIFDSSLSLEHYIKSWCSKLNGTLSYLNRVNTLDLQSRILVINALIFSHLKYCSSIWSKCSEKLQNEVQKCINFDAKVSSNGKYLKRDPVTPPLRDFKWINFNSILLNEASFIYKNKYVSADANVKKIDFDLWNKVSQRINRNNGSDVHRLSKDSFGTKSCLTIGRKAVEFHPDEYQKFKYHRYVQKSYVPTPARAPMATIPNLIN